MSLRNDVGAFAVFGRTGTRVVATRRARRPGSLGNACSGLAVAIALLVGSSCAHADSDAALGESRIKAAFLFKFLGFIDWPPATFDRADAPFIIGVLGADTLGKELEQIATGRQVNGHPVRVRLVGRTDSIAGLQVMFVGRAESSRLNAVAALADSVPLLVVSESEPALAQGSAINFVVVDDKVRFDIALHPINRAGLKISARLLGVARNVQPDPS